MEVGSWFTRESARGDLVGVVKYKDASGRWRQRSRTFRGPRARAEEDFAGWRASLGAGPGRGGTVGDYALSALASDLALGRVERSTYEAQLGYARNHVLPALGALPARELGPAEVEAWAASLSGRLSPASARVAWNVLRKACAAAARAGELPRDPFEGLRPPRARRARPAHLDGGMRLALAEAVREEWGAGSAYGSAALIALLTGLRCGEVCALRWRDVAGGRVEVRQSVGRGRGGGYLKAPKTPASARSFPAPAQLAPLLEGRRLAAAREPGGARPAAFVCGEGGSFADPRALSRAFSRLCARRGIVDSLGDRATFHTLRHTFATVAVAAGMDVKTLSAVLGHSSAKVTLDVYASADEDAKRVGMERVSAALAAVAPPPG